jgi:hypothetical protein
MWIVIHMAKSLQLAQSVHDLLAREGFLVRLRPIYRTLSEDENYYELKVPESEAQEARQVLLDHGF